MTPSNNKETDVPDAIAFTALILEVLIDGEQSVNGYPNPKAETPASQLANWSWMARIASRF